MESHIAGQLLLQLLLIALNAVFACAEIAVISTNEHKMEQMAQGGDRRAARLVRMTHQPARFLATIQVAITLAGFLGSAFAADNFSDLLVTWLLRLGVPLSAQALDTLSVVLITVALSYLTLIFGELVPKRMAMKKAEALALALSALLSFVAKLFAPVVWVLTASTNAVLRLCRINPDEEDHEVSEEDIRLMIDEGTEKGAIDSRENEMLHKVFEFDDLPVGHFSTHRTEMDCLWVQDDIEQWEAEMRQSGHRRYPLCGTSPDDVQGVLDADAYFRLKDKSRETVLKSLVASPHFVPESLHADVLFRQMKCSRNFFAVVLDEYGGVVGIVTMYDLLQQLVGKLEEEPV